MNHKEEIAMRALMQALEGWIEIADNEDLRESDELALKRAYAVLAQSNSDTMTKQSSSRSVAEGTCKMETGEALEIVHKIASLHVNGSSEQLEALNMVEDLIVNYYEEKEETMETTGKELAELINLRNSEIKQMLSRWTDLTKDLPDMSFFIADAEDQGELYLVTGRCDLCTTDDEIGYCVCEDWFFDKYSSNQIFIRKILHAIRDAIPLALERITDERALVQTDRELVADIVKALQ